MDDYILGIRETGGSRELACIHLYQWGDYVELGFGRGGAPVPFQSARQAWWHWYRYIARVPMDGWQPYVKAQARGAN